MRYRPATMSEVILELRVQAGAGKEKSTMLGLDFITKSPGLLLPNVQQLGWDLLPGADEIQATYLDSDGDRCTLTDRTATDALGLAVDHGDDGTKLLEVQVEDKAEAAKRGSVDSSSVENLKARLAQARKEAAAEQELATSCGSLHAELDAARKRAADLEKSL